MHKHIKLTAVIITFNEERNIARCLKSLEGVVDEVVVLDSFSTDRTKEICQEYNVNFFQRTWTGYADQKNHANTLASNDFILSLDADEALSDDLRKSILQLKQEANFEAYSMNRLTNYCGKWIRHCGWYPDNKIRIFNRTNAYWEKIEIHEEINFTSKVPIKQLNGDILHYSYYSIQDHIKQADKFTDLTAKVAFEKHKTSSIFNIFFNPKWKFFNSYILHLGFLDGYYGYIVCKISAHATLLKYIKLRQLINNTSDGIKKNTIE